MDYSLKNVRLTFFKFVNFRFQNALEQIAILPFSKASVEFFLPVLENFFCTCVMVLKRHFHPEVRIQRRGRKSYATDTLNYIRYNDF